MVAISYDGCLTDGLPNKFESPGRCKKLREACRKSICTDIVSNGFHGAGLFQKHNKHNDNKRTKAARMSMRAQSNGCLKLRICKDYKDWRIRKASETPLFPPSLVPIGLHGAELRKNKKLHYTGSGRNFASVFWNRFGQVFHGIGQPFVHPEVTRTFLPSFYQAFAVINQGIFRFHIGKPARNLLGPPEEKLYMFVPFPVTSY